MFQVMDELSLVYGVATAAACFVLPWFALAVAVLVAVRAVRRVRRKERKANRGLVMSVKEVEWSRFARFFKALLLKSLFCFTK